MLLHPDVVTNKVSVAFLECDGIMIFQLEPKTAPTGEFPVFGGLVICPHDREESGVARPSSHDPRKIVGHG